MSKESRTAEKLVKHVKCIVYGQNNSTDLIHLTIKSCASQTANLNSCENFTTANGKKKRKRNEKKTETNPSIAAISIGIRILALVNIKIYS